MGSHPQGQEGSGPKISGGFGWWDSPLRLKVLPPHSHQELLVGSSQSEEGFGSCSQDQGCSGPETWRGFGAVGATPRG